jgi:hypothetical protein
MSVSLVQGDTAPIIRGVIRDDDTGDPLNLTGATVYFQMRKADDHRYTVNAQCTITSPTAGAVAYSLAANDLNTPGTYQGQYEVHYADTSVQTTYNPVAITVRRQ